MFRFVLFLLVTAALVAAAVWLANNPGAVALTWLGWHLETSASLSFIALLVLFIALLVAFRVFGGVRRMPRVLGRGREERRLRRGGLVMGEGIAAIRGGDLPLARRLVREAERLLPGAVGVQMLSAETAAAAGHYDRAQELYTALLDSRRYKAGGRRGLLEIARLKGDDDEVAKLARESLTAGITAPWAVEPLFRILVRRGLWEEALAVQAKADVSREAGNTDHAKVKAALLTARARQLEAEGQASGALKVSQNALSLDPGLIEAGLIAARQSAAGGKTRKATQILTAQWRRQPHPEVARQFRGLLNESDSLEVIKRMEALLDANPDHPQSRIAIAEAALEAHLWGQARQALDPLVRGGDPSPVVCRLVARLEEGENRDLALANQWLSHALAARADDTWLCGRCGAAPLRWEAACPSCGSVGTVAWSGQAVSGLPKAKAD